MALQLENVTEMEIGHVLFMDVVAFSKLLVDEQAACTQALNQLVRMTAQFRAAEAADKLIRLPTGDGMVLVFFTNPEAPVRCAVEIARALKNETFSLRMGVNSGPVNKVSDVNDRSNLAGTGVNIAQRVMDYGDAGHILLSRRVAEDLEQHSHWRPHLQDLGECEVKHGVRVGIVNLFTDEVGNPALPEKLRREKQTRDDAESAAARIVAARRRLSMLGLISLLVLLAIGLGVWKFLPRSSSRRNGNAAVSEIVSLAVKPLDNLSGDPGKDYFAEGMTDELTTKLSQISALHRVVSSSTMMQYRHSTKSSSAIAQEVDVGAMVEGSVVLSGNKARISVQLVDGVTDKTLWAHDYSSEVANIVQLQDRVTMAIADAIALKLTKRETTRLASTRVVNPAAYDYYLRGRSVGESSREDCDVSIGLFEKAVALEPDFAEAYAALAAGYFQKSYFFDTDKELVAKAERLAAQALKLNPELPAAILIQAEILWTPEHGFPHEKAITEIRRALSVAPNFGDAHNYLGAIYFHVGLIEEATAEFRRAEEIMPGAGARFHLGLMAVFEGRYDEAVVTMEKNKNGFVAPFVESQICFALFDAGHVSAARDRIAKARAKLTDEGGLMAATQGLLFAAAGDKEHAEQNIEQALKEGQGFGHFHHTTYAVASAYALLHENAPALQWLKYTADHGFPNLTWFLRDPALAPLRDNPAFTRLTDEMRPRFEKLKALADAPLTIAQD